MYIITGGAGFIGSAFVWKLNNIGIDDILIVDNLASTDKWLNLVGLKYTKYIHKNIFMEQVRSGKFNKKITAIIHMGACSSTTELDADYLMQNNVEYSKVLAMLALENQARFIYASSAATYGDGSKDFIDDEKKIFSLQPLNMYGYSKQLFDLWLQNNNLLDQVVGLKFFNVYGPNEYHKGSMKSVICKSYDQILQTGEIELFKSYQKQYENGGQMRDFIYIKDCLYIMEWLLLAKEINGIYNIGTGTSRSWNDLAHAVFSALEKQPRIKYIEMPEFIKDKYQYFTMADNTKLKNVGCPVKFHSLEDGVKDYVQNYLAYNQKLLTSRY